MVTPSPTLGPTAHAWLTIPLFMDHRNSRFQGRVNFLMDWEYKGNWQMVPGQAPSPSATAPSLETQQEAMRRPVCPHGHVDYEDRRG